MRQLHLAMLVVAGVATSALATTATAQDDAVNSEVLRALNELRQEVSQLREQNRHLQGDLDELKQSNEATIDVSTVLPLEEIFENRQQMDRQARRIDELIARNASLQESVAAVANQPQTDESALYDYSPESVWQPEPFAHQEGWIADVRAIYIFRSEISHDPAFGALTGPIISRSAGLAPSPTVQGTSHNLSSEAATLDGPGIRVSLLKQNGDGWFSGAIFEGIFIHGETRAGGTTDIDNIHANLVNRTLADNNALNDDFDSGLVDFASEDLHLDQETLDFVFGKKIQATDQITAFWNFGLRGAYFDLGREVLYRNIEPLVLPGPIVVPDADMDTANIDFSSKMLGLGPVIGAGATWNYGQYFSLSGDVSLAAVYADFDLRRNESNFNQTLNRTAFSDIKVDSSGVVPMMNCSFELSAQLNSNCSCAVGYSASLWAGGSRSISMPGWDDVDDETQAYTVEKNDIFSQGVYFRLCFVSGR